MKKEFVVISNALIWGIVLLACSIPLKDTGAFQDIQLILGGGATVSLFVVATAGMRNKHFDSPSTRYRFRFDSVIYSSTSMMVQANESWIDLAMEAH